MEEEFEKRAVVGREWKTLQERPATQPGPDPDNDEVGDNDGPEHKE